MKFPFRSLSFASSLLFAGLLPLHGAPDVSAEKSAPLITGIKDLQQLDQQISAIAGKTAAATVSLISPTGGAAGSGVIVNSKGLILSAGHVAAALSGEIIVLFSDGKRATAKKLGADFDRDAAMLQMVEPGEYPYVDVAPADPLPTNTWCLALGHPGGYDPLRTPPLRLGRVIAYGNFMVTDCTVVSGDSGGPLFDIEGRVIGIHSNIGAGLGENRHVPIKVFCDQWDDLLASKTHGKRFNQKPGQAKKPEAAPEKAKKESAATPPPAKPVLGIKIGAQSPRGIAITEVATDSPAAKAGIKAGDVLVRCAGAKVTNAKELTDAIANRPARPNMMVAYRRDGKVHRVRVPLPLPDAPKADAPKADTSTGELDAFIDKALADSKDGKAELKLTPELLEKFGGMDKIKERLAKRMGEKKSADAKTKTEDQPKPAAPLTEKEKSELLAKLFKRAQANSGRLQMTPDEVEKLGGIEEMKKLMRSAQSAPDPFFQSVLAALKPVVKEASESTAEILVDGKPVALGTVVTAGGGILTKNSETAKGSVSVRIQGKTHPATLLKRFADWDLALFQIQTTGLRPARFEASADNPSCGSLLTVPGTTTDPLGIGLVSVKTRPLAQIGFLGIENRNTADAGKVLVKTVVRGGPAEKAGIKTDDIITSINGQPVTDSFAFTRTITRFKPDETVKLEVLRGEEKLTVEAKLGERPSPRVGKDFLKVNRMSGPISPKTDGFPLALQHDIPLEPSQCGGPLLGLDGRCVGLNVARAGRVSTLAIPAGKIAELLEGARADLAAAKPAKSDEVTPEEIAEVTKMLDELQQRLKRIEKRLQPVPAR